MVTANGRFAYRLNNIMERSIDINWGFNIDLFQPDAALTKWYLDLLEMFNHSMLKRQQELLQYHGLSLIILFQTFPRE